MCPRFNPAPLAVVTTPDLPTHLSRLGHVLLLPRGLIHADATRGTTASVRPCAEQRFVCRRAGDSGRGSRAVSVPESWRSGSLGSTLTRKRFCASSSWTALRTCGVPRHHPTQPPLPSEEGWGAITQAGRHIMMQRRGPTGGRYVAHSREGSVCMLCGQLMKPNRFPMAEMLSKRQCRAAWACERVECGGYESVERL